jgi:uncharacterized protein YndB with AHSA1/START domain
MRKQDDMPHINSAIVPVSTRVERHLDPPPEEVFGSYADIDQRVRWAAPADETIVYGSDDFRVGGIDHFVRGPRGNPQLAGTTHYEHIVVDRRIAFVERLMDSADRLLSISVVTWDIRPAGTGTLLTITDQTTSVAGSGPIEGARYGYECLLDRLHRHLTSSAT